MEMMQFVINWIQITIVTHVLFWKIPNLRNLNQIGRAYMAIAPKACFVRLWVCRIDPKAFSVTRRVGRIDPSLAR